MPAADQCIISAYLTEKMKKSHLLVIMLSLSFFVFDYYTKLLAFWYLQKPLVITSWFRFTYQENTGIAWSIPIPHQILIPLNIIMIFAIMYFCLGYLDLRKNLSKITAACIIGGALGNIFDRIASGHVIDFISVSSWPVFNLADIFLGSGVFLLIVFYGKIKRTSKHGK